MSLISITSPHGHGPVSTAQIMRYVLLATVPGIVALTLFFGFGTLINILWSSVIALGCEALMLRLRHRSIGFYLSDYSALVTAVLLGIALPPGSPWWLIAVAIVFAIIVAKHLYGGLGYNPFNPAMVGYVVVLISFPMQMTHWLAPQSPGNGLGFLEALSACFIDPVADAMTMATPLDLIKQNKALLIDDLWQQSPQFGTLGGTGWEWGNAGFALGGLFLLHKKVFSWHAPVAMLVTLALMATVFYDSGSSASGGSPLFHWFSGATMLGAFFILTDPVTSAVSVKGRVLYGALIGALLYLIRVWGNYPDAVAFAVLIGNFCAPFIDHYTQPVAYGHGKRKGDV